MSGWPARRGGDADLVGRLVPYLAFVAVAVATVAGLVVRPGVDGTDPTADRVIVAGAVGLRWEDVDPGRTPHLWRLVGSGAVGSLSVRPAHRPSCAVDGWLTLGAGSWAAGTLESPESPCSPEEVTIETTDARGAHLPAQGQLVRYNQGQPPWRAVPGALAGSVDCTVAVGAGAAVAAARSYGRVDRYRRVLPEDPEAAARLLGDDCELGIVDLGTVSGEELARAATVRRVDAALGRVLAARPPGSLVLVVGVADTEPTPHLQVAVGDAPGLPAGWLTSATTGRTGYLQLVDVAPTALAAVGRPEPEVPLAGNAAYRLPGRPTDLPQAVAALTAADTEAVLTRPVSTWFLAALTVAELVLFAAMVPLLRRPPGRRPADRPAGGRARGWGSVAEMLLVVAGLALPAALVADGLPWWRAEAAGGVFAVTSLAVLAAATVLVVRTPLFGRTLGLVGAGAGVATVAVAVDLLTASWRQQAGMVGYPAQDAGRYAGLSETGLGVLVAGVLLVAGCLAEQVPRRWRPLVIAAVGGLGVVLAGSPYLGADIGGAVALTVGVCVAAARCTGRWLTVGRVAWAGVLGVAVVAAVGVVDLRRPAEQRTGLGRLLTHLAEGTGGPALQRVSLANVEAFTTTPLTLLAVGAGAFIWFALLRPWGGLRRLFAIHPALRAGMLGAVVAALLGGLLVGTALLVAGAAAALGVPLLTLAALRLWHRPAPRPVWAPRPPARVPTGAAR